MITKNNNNNFNILYRTESIAFLKFPRDIHLYEIWKINLKYFISHKTERRVTKYKKKLTTNTTYENHYNLYSIDPNVIEQIKYYDSSAIEFGRTSSRIPSVDNCNLYTIFV